MVTNTIFHLSMILQDIVGFFFLSHLNLKPQKPLSISNFLLKNNFLYILKHYSQIWGKFMVFKIFLQQKGILLRHICPHTHQQNDIIERKHKHIVETCLTFLAQSQLPFSFLPESFHIASFLINRMPTPVLDNSSPFQKLYN